MAQVILQGFDAFTGWIRPGGVGVADRVSSYQWNPGPLANWE
jgi:hypothetical protein